MNNNVEKGSRSDEKPEYGSYIGYSLLAAFGVLGALGLVLIVSGFYVGFFFNLILWIAGTTLITLFLWPAVGISLSSVIEQDTVRPLLRSYDISEFDNPQILDCGCGTGRHAIPFAKQMPEGAFLTGIDIYDKKSINVNALERVQKNAQLEGVADKTKFMFGSVTKIPFEDEKFDVVTCMGILHEVRGIREKEKAFQEIYRVLKPEGVFYLSELNRVAVIPYMGLFGLVLKSKVYWEEQLIKSKFKIVKSNVQGSIIEFIMKKV